MAIELTTCYSDRARSQAASDWRVESRTNGRNFGDRRVMISYGTREAAGRAEGGRRERGWSRENCTLSFGTIDIHRRGSTTAE